MKVFVIMPYGGDDDKKRKHFNRIYRHLIEDAVKLYDETAVVHRQDYTNQNGRIIGNIIRGIAEADLVVADISGRNWNVAYELGLRHVMNAHGTVLICDDVTEIPYDIESMNMLIYSNDNWMDDEEELQKKLCAMISDSMNAAISDSPVHEKYSALPASLTDMLNTTGDADKAQLVELKEKVHELAKENEILRKKIEDAGLNADEKSESTSILSILEPLIESEKYVSTNAVDTLREYATNGQKKEFVRFLAKTLEDGYLDEIDCHNIYIICRKYINIPKLLIAYLEQVVQFYPDDEELQGFLARSYTDDYKNRDKAKALVNKSIGLTQRANTYDISKTNVSSRTLGAFFDVYLSLKLYGELIAISDILLKKFPKHIPLIYRNIISTYLHLDKPDKALEFCDKLLEIDGKNDLSYYSLHRALRESCDYAGAYEALEKCIALDSTDTDYLFSMAGFIADEHYARTSDYEISQVPSSETGKYAIPFILRAAIVEPTSETFQKAVRYIKRNSYNEYLPELEKLLQENRCDVDFSMVEYCYGIDV